MKFISITELFTNDIKLKITCFIVFSRFSSTTLVCNIGEFGAKKYFTDHLTAKTFKSRVAIKGNFSGLLFYEQVTVKGNFPDTS